MKHAVLLALSAILLYGLAFPLPACRAATPATLRWRIQWEDETVIRQAPPGAGAWYPRLLVLPDHRWLAAYDTNIGTNHTYIEVAESVDGGRTWRPISVASFGEGNAANASLALGPDSSLYLAYRLVRPGDFEIRLSRSTDGGRTWEPLSVIQTGRRGLWEPAIGWVGSELWAFYSSEEFWPIWPQVIALRRSVDGGKTWQAEEIAVRNPRSRDGMATWMIHNSTVYMAYEATDMGNPFVIKMVTSSDGALTWSKPILVYRPANWSKKAGAPALAVLPNPLADSHPVIVVGFQTDEDSTLGSGDQYADIKYVTSSDGGRTWSDAEPAHATMWPDCWAGLYVLDDQTLGLSVTAGNRLVLRIGHLVLEGQAGPS